MRCKLHDQFWFLVYFFLRETLNISILTVDLGNYVVNKLIPDF